MKPKINVKATSHIVRKNDKKKETIKNKEKAGD